MPSETKDKSEVSTAKTTFDVEEWFTPWRFSLLLALMIIATFPNVIFGRDTLVYRDFSLFFYPVAHYTRESFWLGELPLWNPYNYCGVPFLAQWNTMTLYPPSLFYLLFPLSWSLGVFALIHLFWAGLGMYWLSWRFTNSRLGASVAGVAFAYSGLMIACLMGLSNLAALAWMPWVIFTFERAWREGGQHIIYAALVGAMQMLTGTPEYILFTWLIITSITAVDFYNSKRTGQPSFAATFKRSLAVVLLIGGLAAAQLLPFFDLLQHSHRHGEASDSIWSMPPWGWANFLVPLFRCYKSPPGVFIQTDQGVFSSYYLGIGILALALFAVCKAREPRVRLFGGIAFLGVVLALGDNGFLYGWLRHAVPIFGFTRYPIKWMVLAGLVLPILAAFGVRELIASRLNKSKAWRLFMVLSSLIFLFIILIVSISYWHPSNQEQTSATLLSGMTRAILLGLTLGILHLLQRTAREKLGLLLSLSFIAIIWLDLATHSPGQNPAVERSMYDAPLPRLQQLKPLPQLGESRAMLTTKAITELKGNLLPDPSSTFLLQRVSLFDNCNLLERIPKLDGFFSLQLEVEQNLFASIQSISPPFADFLGISQYSSDTNIFEWKPRASFLPWITIGQQPVFASDAATLASVSSPQFDPRRIVYLPEEAASIISAKAAIDAKIRSCQFSAQEIVLQTESSTPAILVIAQAYYHNWKPYVDGRPTTLWRANQAFQAIEIPAGQHHVKLAYEDRNFYTGAIISLATLLGCCAALLIWRKQN